MTPEVATLQRNDKLTLADDVMRLGREVMSSEVVTTAPDATLVDAARLMMERKIGCLPVVDDGRLVGILTEGDFVALHLRRKR